MSSIQKINSTVKVTPATFQANESAPNSRVYLNSYAYDSFSPSFGHNGNAVAKNIRKAAPSGGFRSTVKQAVLGGLIGLMVATTACQKRPIQPCNDYTQVTVTNNITISQEELYSYLQQILEAIQQGNAQNAAFFNQVIGYLAENGVGINTIISYLEQNNQYLHDLVQDNEELKQVLLNIEALLATLQAQHQTLGEAQNVLLSQILAAVMNLNANNNTNQAAIIQYLNQLINQMTQMSNENAAYHIAILNAMNHMEQQLQAKLTAILNAIQGMDEHMQAGYLAILAQLQGMEATLQAGLLEVLNHIDQFSAQVQAKLNQLIALANQMNQNMLNCTAQIIAQMQEWEEQDQLNALNILTAINNVPEAIQQLYINLMQQLQNMEQGSHSDFLALMAKLTSMESGQNAILNAMQNLNAEYLAYFAQALAHLETIEQNQATQIAQLADILAAIQNGNAHIENIEEYVAELVNNPISPVNPQVDLSVIEGLLQQILDSQNTTNNLLQDNNASTALILTTTQAIYQKMLDVIQNQEDYNTNFEYYQNIQNDWLENIFDVISNLAPGCDCPECCAQLIEILIQIDQHIQELDWNHEGIDDDLDPLLGK